MFRLVWKSMMGKRKMMGVLWCCCRWTLSWQLSLKFGVGLKFSNTTSRSLLLAIQHLTITHIASCDTYRKDFRMIFYSQSIICDLHCVTGRFSYTLCSKLSNNNVFSFRWWADTVPFGVDTWLKSKDRPRPTDIRYEYQSALDRHSGKSSIHSFFIMRL